MRRLWLAAAITASALATPAMAHAKSLYVSAAGTAAHSCLDMAGACTLDKAVGLAAPDDSVLIDGSGGPVVTTGQQVAQRIFIGPLVPATSARPILAGAGAGVDGAVLRFVSGSQGARLAGVEVRNTLAGDQGVALRVEANDVVVEDVRALSGGTAISAVGTTILRRIEARAGVIGVAAGGPIGQPATIASSLVTTSTTGGRALTTWSSGNSLSAVNVTAISTGAGGYGIIAPAGSLVGGPGSVVTVRNSIARGLAADLSAEPEYSFCIATTCYAGEVSATHSGYRTATGYVGGGQGNTTAEPQFVSATDFHLQPTSPLRDIGLLDPLSQPFDLDGTPRLHGLGVDLGAYEWAPPPAPAIQSPAAAPPAVAAPDIVAPSLSAVRVRPRRFRVSSRSTAVAARAAAGTRIETTLGERATLKLAFARLAPGRRSKGRCSKASPRTLAKTPRRSRCTRATRVQPSLRRQGVGPGVVSFPFSGRLGSRALAPGSYRVTATAADAAGNTSVARRASFSIVRR